MVFMIILNSEINYLYLYLLKYNKNIVLIHLQSTNLYISFRVHFGL